MIRKRFLFLLIIAISVSFFRLGSVSLFDVDEAIFAEATKEMVQNGDWTTPHYNGEKRYDKPILFYWVMAVSYMVFGVNEFGARFPSALCGVFLITATFFFIRSFWNERIAFYSSVAFAFSVYFFMYSHAAVTDMLLTLCITMSLFSFFLSIEGVSISQRAKERFKIVFYFFSGLAFLTKGLIGVLFPFGIAVIYSFLTARWDGVRKIASLKGCILFLVTTVPWYGTQFFINGQEFIDQFFIKHHFKRYTDVNSGHAGPFYYYVLALIAGLFPWIVFLPSGAQNGLRDRDKFSLFAIIWFAFIFVFFSVSTTKLPNYILPAVPAVILLVSRGMGDEHAHFRLINVAIACTSLVIGMAFLVSHPYLVKAGIDNTSWTFVVFGIMTILACSCVFSFFSGKYTFKVMQTTMAGFLLLVSLEVLPIASNLLQGTLYRYSIYARNNLAENERILTYGITFPSIVFYSKHYVVSTGSTEELEQLVKGKMPRLGIAKQKDYELLEKYGFIIHETDGKYALFKRQ